MEKLMNLFLSCCIGVMCVASCAATSSETASLGSEVGSETSKDPMLCFDEIDGDGDTKIDCEDSDCCWACLPETGDIPDCEGENWVVILCCKYVVKASQTA